MLNGSKRDVQRGKWCRQSLKGLIVSSVYTSLTKSLYSQTEGGEINVFAEYIR